jgi:N-acylglucosamine-6-phosphate 2-epimerase
MFILKKARWQILYGLGRAVNTQRANLFWSYPEKIILFLLSATIPNGGSLVGYHEKTLAALKNRVVVSCQPVVGGPMDNTAMVTALGLAAEHGGAAGLRIEGVESVRSLAAASSLPIIGIIKRGLVDSPVIITPLIEDVDALAEAGASIIAYDATQRDRPVTTAAIVKRIRESGLLAMADCARIEDGNRALAEGAEILGTTLSGYAYTELPEISPPDLNLVQEFAAMDTFVIAEGRIRTPDEAAEAISHGANSVVVGSAITRVEHITSWFSAAIADAAEPKTRVARP